MGQGLGSRRPNTSEPGPTLATTTTTSKSKSRPRLPLISSRLVFFGNENQETKKPDDFITNATSCPGNSTTTSGSKTKKRSSPNPSPTRRPIHLKNCGAVPFEPGFSLTPASLVQDQPDGFATEVTVNHEREDEIDNSEVKTITVQLPEGMTLNPSAAAGLTACTPAQARIHSSEPGRRMPRQLRSRDRQPGSADAPGRLAQRQPLPRRSRIRPDHRTALHDVPRRGVRQVRHLGAPEGRSVPQRSHRAAHDGLQRTPRTAVQQGDPALQGRRAGARCQPARRARPRPPPRC